MHKAPLVLMIAAVCLTGCKKSFTPLASSAKPGGAIQQKLQELAGVGATDCGRLKAQAQDQMKTASTCALQAAQSKHPFYVAYDLPGMTVAVAGSSDGKLYWVQSQEPENAQPGAAPQLKSALCPSELRMAQSGRVTCFAPGSFGMSSTGARPHGGLAMPPAGAENPHGGMGMPPAGTPSPHASPSSTPPAKQP